MPQLQKFFVASMLTLTACAGGGVAERTLPCGVPLWDAARGPVGVYVAPSARPHFATAVAGAIGRWNEIVGGRALTMVPMPPADHAVFVIPTATVAKASLYYDLAECRTGVAVVRLPVQWPLRLRQRVTDHEFGHVMGFPNIDKPNHLMVGVVEAHYNGRGHLSPSDRMWVRSRWRAFAD